MTKQNQQTLAELGAATVAFGPGQLRTDGKGFDLAGWSYLVDDATGMWAAARPGYLGFGASPDLARQRALEGLVQ